MTPTTTATIPALDALRRPIRDYAPATAGGVRFQGAMLDLADDLEDLWTEGEVKGDLAGEDLETEVLASALYGFSALVTAGPPAGELLELVLPGVAPEAGQRPHAIDAETRDTLHTVGTIRGVLLAFEPPGFTAALWRAALLATYRMIEIFVLLGDQRSIDQCFYLLDGAEALADRFAEQA